jgi:hypothetical protein
VAVPEMMNADASWRKHLEADGGNDLLAAMIKTFADALMSADADADLRRRLRRGEP